ncbi:DNA-binding transcriptional LysR family regulator [Pseudacidovorax sp. 1753]|uniref:LysR family transcriptional regulator n=1 Tax=Pseudacidovorax sp. 1753 TaxID=3156419 RepID=UPI00339B2F8E
MDLIDQLRVFTRVAHSGGFTAAAQQLGLPRTTVSFAIQQLEGRLGARLLNRTTRRVSLTQDGEAMLERALLLVAEAEELTHQFDPSGTAVSGRLRVDLPSRMARLLAAPALPALLARHPGLVVELGSSDRAVDLVLDGVDCALRVGGLSASSLVARPLGMLRLGNYASPAYLAAHGVPQTPEDLPAHCAVNYAPPSLGRAVPWEWTQDGELRTLDLGGRVTVNNVETYIACCLAGVGLIQVPVYDVRAHLAAGELVEVLHDWPAPPMPMNLVHAHRRHLSRRVLVFADWLTEVLAATADG